MLERSSHCPHVAGPAQDVGSFVSLNPWWPLPPPTDQPAFSSSCVLPLSFMGLVIGKFQLEVIKPVTVHSVWLLWGTRGEKLRVYRPAPGGL